MPMYEYQCSDCGTHFDMLRSMSQADAEVACPSCGSPQTRRKLSVFAAVSKEGNGSAAASAATESGGSCCIGGSCGCSLN